MFSNFAFGIFQESIDTYHIKDDVYQEFSNPYPKDKIEHLLYRKNWIDTVQWHYEDIIRDPAIDPVDALDLKRKIDASNQDRTDLVEYIDGYFLHKYQSVQVKENATINTKFITGYNLSINDSLVFIMGNLFYFTLFSIIKVVVYCEGYLIRKLIEGDIKNKILDSQQEI